MIISTKKWVRYQILKPETIFGGSGGMGNGQPISPPPLTFFGGIGDDRPVDPPPDQ